MAVFGIVVGVALIWLIVSMFTRVSEVAVKSSSQELENEAGRYAAVVAKRLAEVQSTLDGHAFDPDLAEALVTNDAEGIAQQEQRLKDRVPGAITVRLLQPGLSHTDNSTTPPIGYASLEVIRRAEQQAMALPAELHGKGGEHEHIVFVQPVFGQVAKAPAAVAEVSAGESVAEEEREPAAEGEPAAEVEPAAESELAEEVIGVIWLAHDVSLLEGLFKDARDDGLVLELRQPVKGTRAQVLARHGSKEGRAEEPTVQAPVRGSIWKLAAWSPSTFASGVESAEDAGGLPYVLLAGLVVLAAVAGGLVVVRRRRRAGAAVTASPGAVFGGAVKELEKGRVPAAAGPGAAVPSKAAPAKSASPQQPAGAADEQAPAAEAAPAQVEVPASIFRAYDIRGIVGKTLTADIVREIGRAIGSEAYDRGQQGVIVARDGRNSGPELIEALIEGLRSTGQDVIDIGMVPTPVLYYATHYMETGSGVMLTGSHNPPDYNGLKITLGGESLSGEAITALHQRIVDGNLRSGNGSMQAADIMADYIRRVSEDVPVAFGNAFKLVVDCGNGVAGALAPQLFRALGHDVIELFCEVDGNFPNHHPDPSQPANLADAIRAVKEQGADLGLAFDGDGDRVGVIDANGNIIWPDSLMILFARDVISRNPGAQIIYDVKCSSHLGLAIEAAGGVPVMWKTGHSIIKAKMKESGALLAGEMSGHIFFKERWYGFDDALYASARLLEILMHAGKPPAEVFAELPVSVNTPELRIDMPETEHVAFMQAMSGNPAAFGDAKLTTIDGVRADFPGGWGLIRASNTTPSLIMRFEADSEEKMAAIQDIFRKAITAVKPDIKLPY